MRDVRGIYNAVVVLADAGRLDLAQEVFDLADEQRVPVEIEKLRAENERLKAAAQAVVDAELVTGYAIIAPSSEEFDKIVKQRKRELEQAIYALGKVLPKSVESLLAERDALQAEVAALKAENAELLAALESIVEMNPPLPMGMIEAAEQAIARCVVQMRLGDEVDVLEELAGDAAREVVK